MVLDVQSGILAESLLKRRRNMIFAASTGGGNSPWFWVIYAVFFGGLFYFMAYLPQKKEKKRKAELMTALSVGDSVLTSAGFYGVLIDITEDMVIVEFGNNKNCRIPMKKESIVEVEKAE